MFNSLEDIYNFFTKNPNISIDSRTTKKSDIFFSISGEKFDGNEFALQAIEKGAAVAFVDKREFGSPNKNIFYVDDCLKLLQCLSKLHRDKLNKPIIAITGTNGKTTTRYLINSVLSKKFSVHSNFSNYNNHIGVPLTLLSIKDSHDIVVLELAASRVGDIKFLCDLSKPNYGYISNFGKAHLRGFGSVDNIVKTKLELYDYLRSKKGKVFFNIDDPIQVSNSKNIDRYSFGRSNSADFNINSLEKGIYVSVSYKNNVINSKIFGSYNFYNIAAAICIGRYFGVDDIDINDAIINLNLSDNRSQLIKLGSNTIILDAYNSNPSSLKAAMESFLKIKGKKKAFIGDIMDLGKDSHSEHLNFLESVKDIDIEDIFVIGKNFSSIDCSKYKSIKSFVDLEQCKRFISKKFKTISQTNILVKGSRAMKMENIVDVLEKRSK